MTKKKILKNNKGITLVALVVTIVILLILAGITINLTLGNNGIIKKAKYGKLAMEIEKEKEIIELTKASKVVDYELEKEVTVLNFEEELKINSDQRDVVAIGNIDSIIVNFRDTNRYYEIDKYGNIQGPIELGKDEHAGDITKGGSLDGTEEKPYEIDCIEDLVAFSKNVNEGKNNYKNKYIILKRTLDFNSIFSYNNYKTVEYDLYLGGDGKTELKTQLSNKGKGFVPIGKGNYSFAGIFDGKNNEIQNIYINSNFNSALFGQAWEIIIKNIGITVEIINEKDNVFAAGILARGEKNHIINCCNKANVSVSGINNSIGGITGGLGGNIIENCYNYGTIIGTYYTGGITSGHGNNTTIVRNCINFGCITSKRGTTGGIIGTNAELVENCINLGELDSEQYVSGICGNRANQIKNCANLGKIKRKTTYCNSICYNAKNPFDRCYYNSELLPEGISIESELVDVKGKDMEEIINLMNSYTDETGSYPAGWRKWKVGKNGLPELE